MPSNTDVINLVVTCSSRKASAPEASLQARNLRGATLTARVRNWTHQLSIQTKGIAASELYKGDHWTVVRSIAPFRGAAQVNVWIASAGYGLISPHTKIVAYAATLAARHVDSVASSSGERRAWWASLTTRTPRGVPGSPHNVRQLAARFSSSPLIIAASPEYIDAMTDDILAASRRLSRPELLSILCRVDGAPPELQPFAVTLTADLASELGGTLTSLNARVLRWLVSTGTATLVRPTILRNIRRLAGRCSKRIVPQRARMTDGEIRKRIVFEQRRVWRSRSALLKTIREQGYAVEQARFGRIYEEVSEANSAE